MAIHNIIRFTRDIKILSNRVMVCSFYIFTILQALFDLAHNVLYFCYNGALIYELCKTDGDETMVGNMMMILQILNSFANAGDILVITCTMYQLRHRLALIRTVGDLGQQIALIERLIKVLAIVAIMAVLFVTVM